MKVLSVLIIAVAGLLAGSSASTKSSQASVNTPPVRSETLARYEIVPARSKFMVKASRGGLLWFKGHDHHLAVRDFGGHAELVLDVLEPSSLELNVRSASLEETSDEFTTQQKAIINRELKDIVLESQKYPEIKFKSTKVTGTINNGRFEIIVGGDITLHGVTRHLDIPAMVSLEGNTLRAVGKFAINRSDFNVKATSAFHGLVRVKNKLKFTFDIVAERSPVASSIQNES